MICLQINILSKEPNEIKIQINAGASVNVDEPVPVIVDDPVVVPVGNSDISGLNRPQNLKIGTGFGYVDLKWDTPYEAGRIGYNIYYGKTSGSYARRRTVGKYRTY